MNRIIRYLILMSLLGIALAVCLRAEDPPTPSPPTIESLQKEVADLKAQIAQLQAQLSDMTALRDGWRQIEMQRAAQDVESKMLADKRAQEKQAEKK
ncbi:MAG TPA: hypothetical protein VJQ82_02610 [Terriglobales bacterium]|nr:hypothetical protein [Terriglobales bacterium]